MVLDSRLLRRVAPVILATAVAAGATGPGATAAAHPAPNVLFTPLLARLRRLYIPAVLPATIPFKATTSSKLYATLDDRSAFSYLINIGYTAACHGTGARRDPQRGRRGPLRPVTRAGGGIDLACSSSLPTFGRSSSSSSPSR